MTKNTVNHNQFQTLSQRCHLGYLDGLAAWRHAAKKHAVSLKWGPVSEAPTMENDGIF